VGLGGFGPGSTGTQKPFTHLSLEFGQGLLGPHEISPATVVLGIGVCSVGINVCVVLARIAQASLAVLHLCFSSKVVASIRH